MNIGMAFTMALYAGVFFVAGWGWGQWRAERNIRHEKLGMERGRIAVSMPANLDDASKTMEMLASLLRDAENQRKAAALNALDRHETPKV